MTKDDIQQRIKQAQATVSMVRDNSDVLTSERRDHLLGLAIDDLHKLWIELEDADEPEGAA